MSSENRYPCVDKEGCTFEVGSCGEGDLSCLIEMYDGFAPMPASQGLPPEDPQARLVWVKEMVSSGEGFAAFLENRVIGHAVLMPSASGETGEFVIFVDRAYRDRGIGSALTQKVLKRAKSLGMTSLWLTVESYNFRAINLYKKFGFTFCSGIECERTMTLELKKEPSA